jgi:predicted nicotinamide N-methyase
MTREELAGLPPLEAIGKVIRDKVLVEGKTFWIDHPDESHRLLDPSATRPASTTHDHLPFWAELWPASRMLAKAILREPWTPGLEALEIGCGLGLPGIAALARGLRLTFTDYNDTALRFAAVNARLNGYEHFRVLRLDWRFPPEDLRVPVVLGSDLAYEPRSVAPLVGLIKKVLQPEGLFLLTDQDRVPSYLLRETLALQGLEFTTQITHAGEPGGRRFKGTLYRIRHRH